MDLISLLGGELIPEYRHAYLRHGALLSALTPGLHRAGAGSAPGPSHAALEALRELSGERAEGALARTEAGVRAFTQDVTRVASAASSAADSLWFRLLDLASTAGTLAVQPPGPRRLASVASALSEGEALGRALVDLDAFICQNVAGATQLALVLDRLPYADLASILEGRLAPRSVPYARAADAALRKGAPTEPTLLGLSDVFATLRELEAGTLDRDAAASAGSGAAWVAPDSFSRVTRKFWLRKDDALAFKVALVRHIPILTYGGRESVTAVAEGREPARHAFAVGSAPGDGADPSESPSVPLPPTLRDMAERRDGDVITSVYFDEPGSLPLYHGRLRRDDGALALRLRWYGDAVERPAGEPDSDGPLELFVERKTHREPWNELPSTKERASVGLEGTRALVAGRVPAGVPAGSSPGQLLEEAATAVREGRLVPLVRTRYRRTAFQRADTNDIRVSMDSELGLALERAPDAASGWDPRASSTLGMDGASGTGSGSWGDSTAPSAPTPSPPGALPAALPYIVVEIKLSVAPPMWLTAIAAQARLLSVRRYSKFLHGTASLLPDHIAEYPSWMSSVGPDGRPCPAGAPGGADALGQQLGGPAPACGEGSNPASPPSAAYRANYVLAPWCELEATSLRRMGDPLWAIYPPAARERDLEDDLAREARGEEPLSRARRRELRERGELPTNLEAARERRSRLGRGAARGDGGYSRDISPTGGYSRSRSSSPSSDARRPDGRPGTPPIVDDSEEDDEDELRGEERARLRALRQARRAAWRARLPAPYLPFPGSTAAAAAAGGAPVLRHEPSGGAPGGARAAARAASPPRPSGSSGTPSGVSEKGTDDAAPLEQGSSAHPLAWSGYPADGDSARYVSSEASAREFRGTGGALEGGVADPLLARLGSQAVGGVAAASAVSALTLPGAREGPLVGGGPPPAGKGTESSSTTSADLGTPSSKEAGESGLLAKRTYSARVREGLATALRGPASGVRAFFSPAKAAELARAQAGAPQLRIVREGDIERGFGAGYEVYGAARKGGDAAGGAGGPGDCPGAPATPYGGKGGSGGRKYKRRDRLRDQAAGVAVIRSRVEPKTFFANERTFLQWLQISVLVMFTGLSLLSGSSGSTITSGAAVPATGSQSGLSVNATRISGAIIAPVAILFMVYALIRYKIRTYQILRQQTLRYDDQWGPFLLVILLTSVVLISYVISVTYAHL